MAQHERILFPAEGPAAPTRNRTPWGLADIGLAVGVLFLAALVIMIPAVSVASLVADGFDAVGDDPTALAILLTSNLFLEGALLIAAIQFSVRKHRCSWRDLGLAWPQRGGLWLPVLVLIASYAFLGIYFGILTASHAEDLFPKDTLPDATFDSPAPIVLAGLLAIALAPVAEETFFRGFIFGALRGRWGLLWAALASSLLFAVLHFSLGALIPFTAIGAIFAWAYVYSGSLFASMTAHLAFNTISFTLAVSGVAG